MDTIADLLMGKKMSERHRDTKGNRETDEFVVLVDNCSAANVKIEDILARPSKYFTTSSVIKEHQVWRGNHRRADFSEDRAEKGGFLHRQEKINGKRERIEEITRDEDYLEIRAAVGLTAHGKDVGFLTGMMYTALGEDLEIKLRDSKEADKIAGHLEDAALVLDYDFNVQRDANTIRLTRDGNKKKTKLRKTSHSSLKKKYDFDEKELCIDEEEQALQREGREFFDKEKVIKYFEGPGKENVLTSYADKSFARYTGLLTKKIVADMFGSKQNRDYLAKGQTRNLVNEAMDTYNTRLKELDLEGKVCKRQLKDTRRAFNTIINRTYQESLDSEGKTSRLGRSVSKLVRGLPTDMKLVYKAFTGQFTTNDVKIFSRDRDVGELIRYINLAREAGYVTARNRVSVQYV